MKRSLGTTVFAVLVVASVAFAQGDPEAYEQGRRLGEQIGRIVAGPCCLLMIAVVVMAVLMNGGVGFGLALGIVVFPFAFSWFTLREGFGAAARVVAFLW